LLGKKYLYFLVNNAHHFKNQISGEIPVKFALFWKISSHKQRSERRETRCFLPYKKHARNLVVQFAFQIISKRTPVCRPHTDKNHRKIWRKEGFFIRHFDKKILILRKKMGKILSFSSKFPVIFVSVCSTH